MLHTEQRWTEGERCLDVLEKQVKTCPLKEQDLCATGSIGHTVQILDIVLHSVRICPTLYEGAACKIVCDFFHDIWARYRV